MALEIKWSTKAEISLDYLIIYLQNKWGTVVVQEFMQKLFDFLEILTEFPEIGAIQYP